jgi:TolA-binding protein
MKPPGRYKEQKQLVAQLEQQAQQLQRDAADLQEQNEALVLRQAFVHAWCEGMATLQRYSGGQPNAAAADGSCSQTAGVAEVARVLLQQLQDAEGSLLQQLSPANSSATASQDGAGNTTSADTAGSPTRGGSGRASPRRDDAHGATDTITMAPASDPLAVCQRSLRALAATSPAALYGMTCSGWATFRATSRSR